MAVFIGLNSKVVPLCEILVMLAQPVKMLRGPWSPEQKTPLLKPPVSRLPATTRLCLFGGADPRDAAGKPAVG
jgi:hypothetical protein